MTEIAQVKTLNTLASVRKATQECIKPTIEQIERKMSSLSRQTTLLITKTDQMKEFQGRQNRTEDTMKEMKQMMLEVRELCQDVQLSQAKDQQQTLRSEEGLRDDIRKLKEDRSKQNTTIELMNQRSGKVLQDVKENLKRMQNRELLIEERFKTFNDRAQKMNFSINDSSEQMKSEFEQVRLQLDKQLRASSKRLQLLDNYQVEKEITNNRMRELEERLQITVTRQQFSSYRLGQEEEHERMMREVQASLDRALPRNTKELLQELPVIKEQLAHCLKFERQIGKVREEMELKDVALKRSLSEEKEYRNKREEVLRQQLANASNRYAQMQKEINRALSFEDQMNRKLGQHTSILKTELRNEAQVQSKQLYHQIKISFADKTQKQRKVELEQIQIERDRMFDRAQEIEQIGKQISQVLANFSSKITMIRSDNELFEGRVRKELKQLDQLKGLIGEQATQTGSVIAQLMQATLLQQCIEIQSETPDGEEVAFTTNSDGVLYQHKNKTAAESGTITYRRRRMKLRPLRRALVAGLLASYDLLHNEKHHLGWAIEGPTYFFKQLVQPVYRNLLDKSIACDDDRPTMTRTARDQPADGASTLPYKDGGLSSIDEPTRRYSTIRSRSKNRSRYDESTSKFLVQKSARRVNGNLNYTLSLAS